MMNLHLWKLFIVAFHRPHLHFTLVALAFLLFTLWFFFSRLRLVFGQLRRKWNPPAPYDPILLHFYKNAALFWSFFVLLGIALMSLALYLAGYQYIRSAKVELAGTVSRHGATIRFTNYDDKKMMVEVRGAEAAAGGIFVRFPSWMSYLGLETYHRLITFRGFQENKYHYLEPEPAWLEGYTDRFFLFLYKHRKGLKVVNAFYTESPYFSGPKHTIFVTHSGYIIQ